MQSVQSTGCNFLVDKPTRITTHSATCIDHIYSNLNAEKLNNFVILSGISDHFGTFSKIDDICLNKNDQHMNLHFRKSNLTELEWSSLNSCLDQSLKDEIPFKHLLNPDYLSNSISETYTNVINKHMPLIPENKQKTKDPDPDKPWITSGWDQSKYC